MVTFVAILARMAGLMVAFSSMFTQSIPNTVRAGLCISVTVLVFPLMQDAYEGIVFKEIMNPGQAISFLGAEILDGAFIGWLAELMMLSLPIAMQIVSVFIGISNVLQPDPELGAQSTPISHVTQNLVTVIIFTSGLYVFPIHAVIESYSIFRPGHLLFLADMSKSVAETTEMSFSIAFQLAMPFVLIGTLWPVMLGLLSRFSPGLQVYMLAMPAQILIGILVLSIFIESILSSWESVLQKNFMSLPTLSGM